MMPSRNRRTTAGLLAATLFLVAAGPTSAGYPEDWEPLVFELTLTGDVDSEDTFAVSHACADGAEQPECIFIEPWSYFCSGNEDFRADYGYPECVAGTFRIELERAAGVTVEYELLRWPDWPEESTLERHLADSLTVPEGGITINLGYDYAPATPPALPDTAMAPASSAAGR